MYLLLKGKDLKNNNSDWHYDGLNTYLFKEIFYRPDFMEAVINTSQDVPEFEISEDQYNNCKAAWYKEVEGVQPTLSKEQLLEIQESLVDQDFRITMIELGL